MKEKKRMLKYFGIGPRTSRGFSFELLDLAEQIEKGVKCDRIPMNEALETLRNFDKAYPKKAGISEKHLSEKGCLDELDVLITIMEQIENGEKSGRIPTKKAISFFRKLNDKYPIEE